MTRDEIVDAVRAVLSQYAPEADVDALDPEALLQEQLDLDSMDFLNAMIAIHAATGVDIPEADYGEVATFESLVRYVSERAAVA
jgi:acyl carrier protein